MANIFALRNSGSDAEGKKGKDVKDETNFFIT